MKTPERVVRGKAALNAELAKAERAKQQEPEDAMANLLDELHIDYIRQHRYAFGRRLRADFALPKWHILIEICGGIWQRRAHGSIKGVLADIDRLNQATLSGWFMLRFLPDQITDDTTRAILERLSE